MATMWTCLANRCGNAQKGIMTALAAIVYSLTTKKEFLAPSVTSIIACLRCGRQLQGVTPSMWHAGNNNTEFYKSYLFACPAQQGGNVAGCARRTWLHPATFIIRRERTF